LELEVEVGIIISINFNINISKYLQYMTPKCQCATMKITPTHFEKKCICSARFVKLCNCKCPVCRFLI